MNPLITRAYALIGSNRVRRKLWVNPSTGSIFIARDGTPDTFRKLCKDAKGMYIKWYGLKLHVTVRLPVA